MLKADQIIDELMFRLDIGYDEKHDMAAWLWRNGETDHQGRWCFVEGKEKVTWTGIGPEPEWLAIKMH